MKSALAYRIDEKSEVARRKERARDGGRRYREFSCSLAILMIAAPTDLPTTDIISDALLIGYRKNESTMKYTRGCR